ncbi:hypothetical protein [Bacillus cereus]|uniref:Uncharacterized protein n=1 Tax=Bacillus cereus TaxID=1396 RepID=A0A164QCD3_BACCE|nr:hypothetical protein [Bacillus cereus]KZD70953.1 hypothetical protein B4088_1009 [Bacillus cereus]
MNAILIAGDYFYEKEVVEENQIKVVSEEYVKKGYLYTKKYCDRYKYFTNVSEEEVPFVVVWDEEKELFLGYYNRAGEYKERHPKSWSNAIYHDSQYFYERLGLNIKRDIINRTLVQHEYIKEIEIYVNDNDVDLLDLMYERTIRLLEPEYSFFGVAEREVNKVVLQFYKNPKFETFETIVIGTADYIDKLVEMVDRENELRLEAQEHTMHVDVLASINGEWEKIGVLPLDFAAQIGPRIRENKRVFIQNRGKRWINKEDRILIGDEKYDVFYQEWVVEIYLSWED